MADTLERYDAIVVGSGQGGGPLATALAGAGKRTAIIEREYWGGTCVNVGCTPSKTMIASARIAHLARRSADYGVTTNSVAVDMAAVVARKRAVVDSFRQGSESRQRNVAGLDAIDGEARFTGHKELTVHLNGGGERRLTADLIFLDTGTRPNIPNIPGLDEAPYLTSTSIMEIETVPSHLVIVGGGAVGLEFAQMFRRFGSRVTMLVRGERLLRNEDGDVAEALAKVLTDEGISLRFSTNLSRVSPYRAHGLRLTVSGPSGMVGTLDASHLLLATGRTPNTDALDPAATGVELDDRGFIPTNERLETNVPGIYALGDVRGGLQFTHISYDDFRVIKANLLDGGTRTVNDRPEPWVIFTDPELGRVGLTEREALERGHKIRVAKLPMSSVARAIEVSQTQGLMKAVVDAETEQILGAAILGVSGGEVMTMLQIAMMGKLPYPVLRDAVIAHPTLAESLNNLFSSFQD